MALMCSDCDQCDASAAHLQDADVGNFAMTKINLRPFGSLGSLQLFDWPAQKAETLRFPAINQLKDAGEAPERSAIDNQSAPSSL